MAKTPNLGLNITSILDNQKTFLDFRSEVAGDSADSNMVIIDTEFGKINLRIQNGVIFSSTQPTSQSSGDVWNEELTQ